MIKRKHPVSGRAAGGLLRVILLSMLLTCSHMVIGQSVSDSLMEVHAQKMAKQMQDSLGLTSVTTSRLAAINRELSRAKQASWSIADRDSLGRKLQMIENSRDSLYRTVLTASEYTRYKANKRMYIRKLD